MKKKLILTISIVLVFALTMFIVMQNDERVIYESGVHSIEVADALAMMYETEFGSGEYVVSDDTTWPLEGYVFNAELSRCENGSKLIWDDESKRVVMQANTSDKCYVYFDAYEPLVITSYNLSVGCSSPGNYLLDVVTNRKVEVLKYVLELDNGKTMETYGLGYDVWNSYLPDGSRNFSELSTYSYNLYLITVDGEKSEKVSGTLYTGSEVCPKPPPSLPDVN